MHYGCGIVGDVAPDALSLRHEEPVMVRINDLVDPRRFSKEQYIQLLYEVIFQRTPDAAAFETLMRRTDVHNSLQRVHIQSRISTEFTKLLLHSWAAAGRIGASAHSSAWRVRQW